jgi:hypothetical protein
VGCTVGNVAISVAVVCCRHFGYKVSERKGKKQGTKFWNGIKIKRVKSKKGKEE